MTTGLWVTASGASAERLLAVIPPACRRRVDMASAGIAADEAVLETPTWPAAGATHFVPSFSALTEAAYSVRLELSVRVGGGWSPWAAGASLGAAPFPPLTAEGPLSVDIDEFHAPAPVEAVRVRARLRGAGGMLGAPWILTLSAASPGAAGSARAGGRAVRLAVPPLSQMEWGAALAPRVCSPTSVAMVLDFWRRPADPATLAAEMFHAPTDRYGVWPAAVMAAGRHGVAGYLLRFPDWTSAAWCLAEGLPVIVSVRYGAGELTGAAITETSGHLLVLTGLDGDRALVNDPAAPSAAAVARRYRIDELARVWLERAGVGYVLFPLGG